MQVTPVDAKRLPLAQPGRHSSPIPTVQPLSTIPARGWDKLRAIPFHEAVTEAARRAGLRFILNVVLDDDKHILRVTAGDPELAFQDLVNFAKSVYEVSIPQQYDIAIGGVGFPKDANLYQASRAPSYLFFAPTPVVRKGGFFIIPARCEEGAGAGVGEQRFFAAMRDAPNVQFILDDARKMDIRPDSRGHLSWQKCWKSQMW